MTNSSKFVPHLFFMEQREPRKRIRYEHKKIPALVDHLEFVRNKCSDQARKVCIEIEDVHIELWFDKHYHDRHQLGDQDGKREGIDPKTVEALVRKSLKHLLFYSVSTAGFKFINLGPSSPSVRVVLQQRSGDSILNVVIEAHYHDITHYEITVKTAMCTDDFRIAVGQYCIELQEDGSILRRRENNKMVEICTL